MYTMWVPNNPYLHYKRGNNTVKQPQQVKLKGSDRLYICLLAVLQPKLPLPGTLIVLFSYCITTPPRSRLPAQSNGEPLLFAGTGRP